MKKILLAVITVFCAVFASAQKNSLEKITFNLTVPITSSLDFPVQETPFATNCAFTTSLNFITTKTLHHLKYNMTSNTLQTLQGYRLKNDWDVYGFFSKNLNSQKKYLGFGLEKVFVPHINVPFVVFMELGTKFPQISITWGVVVSPRFFLLQKK